MQSAWEASKYTSASKTQLQNHAHCASIASNGWRRFAKPCHRRYRHAHIVRLFGSGVCANVCGQPPETTETRHSFAGANPIAGRDQERLRSSFAHVDLAPVIGIAREAHFVARLFRQTGQAHAGFPEQTLDRHRLQMSVPEAGGLVR